MSNINPLKYRTQSGFPLSVATGLAMETVFDPVSEVIDETRVPQEKIDHSRYNLYLVNIETISRNILNAVDTNTIMSSNVKQLEEVLVEELSFLNDFYNQHDLRVEFYRNEGSYYKSKYKDCLRIPSTKRMIKIDDLITKSIKNASRNNKGIHIFKRYIKFRRSDKVLMFTHLPIDLLSYRNFTVLDLLESHTGVVKSRREFNSKYFPVGDSDMSRLPFNEELLTTFGDRVTFKPGPLRVRKELLNKYSDERIHPLISDESLKLIINKK